MASTCIQIRGARVHNLKRIDLDIPHRRLIAVCGRSGSGKTSLALDTLYAEGQRRYIDSFSAYTRQFLERLDRPEADRIDGIPPAIAVTHKNPSRSSRATVGTASETIDYLRLLYARIGETICTNCGQPVTRASPESAAEVVGKLPAGTRLMVVFPIDPAAVSAANDGLPWHAVLRDEGFVRTIVGGATVVLAERGDAVGLPLPLGEGIVFVVVDRLTTGELTASRLREALELAFEKGAGRCGVLVEVSADSQTDCTLCDIPTQTLAIDGRAWHSCSFSEQLACGACDLTFPTPEPRLLSFNSPLGACPACQGFGRVAQLDFDLIVPDKTKSLRAGAVAPWHAPAYAHELQELLALADDFGLRVDVPYAELTAAERRIVHDGVAERKFGGLVGFFAWLEKRKYKMHLRVFLNRWRSWHVCPTCGGTRLRPEALATRIGGLNIAELAQKTIREVAQFLRELPLADWRRRVARGLLDQIAARLAYLEAVGLGYLALDRALRTLSGGEAQRVALTSALGSSLVNMLYVLDEPTVGLHPHDVGRLVDAIRALRDRGNTVVAVEHEESLLTAADQVIEIGPESGERGGQVVFQGTPAEMLVGGKSLSGDYLAGRRGALGQHRRREPSHGILRLIGARGNNLANLTVEFPLGLLCVVTGVSGSGKSTLVAETLYPALCQRLRKDGPPPAAHDELIGAGQLTDVALVDQSPLSRSPRSNPATFIKAFDEIRQLFAEAVEARTRNYTPAHFSFNIELGRCPACSGDGQIAVDMQFLADVTMTCGECHGRRYRREILDVQYRGRSIADVLDLTVREAFTFFRGQTKLQARLKRLMDVGLDYLRLGQGANTLSGGEAQRLKLAGHLAAGRRGRTLFILDEPTTGLHFHDVVQLLDCLDALLAVGHSLIVVEHNLQLIKAADYLIDLGPGAADDGGQIVATGAPEEIAANPDSVTGRYLAPVLDRDRAAAEN